MTKYTLTSREMGVLAALFLGALNDNVYDYTGAVCAAKLSFAITRGYENLIEMGFVEVQTLQLKNDVGGIETHERQVLSTLGELVFRTAEPQWKISYDVEVEI